MAAQLYQFTVAAEDYVAGRELPWEPAQDTELLVLIAGQVYQQRGVDWQFVEPQRLLLLVPADIPLGSRLDVYWLAGPAAGMLGKSRLARQPARLTPMVNLPRAAQHKPRFLGSPICPVPSFPSAWKRRIL